MHLRNEILNGGFMADFQGSEFLLGDYSLIFLKENRQIFIFEIFFDWNLTV